jgi:hypothetical protein
MSDSDPGTCAWCGGPVGNKRHSNCSPVCREQWRQHGHGPSQRQIERRMAHIDASPRGCETIEQWIAAGGSIYRES